MHCCWHSAFKACIFKMVREMFTMTYCNRSLRVWSERKKVIKTKKASFAAGFAFLLSVLSCMIVVVHDCTCITPFLTLSRFNRALYSVLLVLYIYTLSTLYNALFLLDSQFRDAASLPNDTWQGWGLKHWSSILRTSYSTRWVTGSPIWAILLQRLRLHLVPHKVWFLKPKWMRANSHLDNYLTVFFIAYRLWCDGLSRLQTSLFSPGR